LLIVVQEPESIHFSYFFRDFVINLGIDAQIFLNFENNFLRIAKNNDPNDLITFGKKQCEALLWADVALFMYKPASRLAQVLTEDENNKITEYIRKPFRKGMGGLNWLAISYPSMSYWDQSLGSWKKFRDNWFKALFLNYTELMDQIAPFVELFHRTKEIRICGEKMDISLSVEGMPFTLANGTVNSPSGGLNGVPKKYSTIGTFYTSSPMVFRGVQLPDLFLRFENGKVLEYWTSCNMNFLHELFKDESMRYLAELSFGFNKFLTLLGISHPMFDEYKDKIWRIALGNSHEKHEDANVSASHWDLPFSIFGLQIYFDGVLIWDKDHFVLPFLAHLNL